MQLATQAPTRRGRRGILTPARCGELFHGPNAARWLERYAQQTGEDLRRRDLFGLTLGLGISACSANDQPAVTPLTLWGANVIRWLRGDYLTLTGTSVDSAIDLSGTGNSGLQTGSTRPTVTLVDSSLHGLPTVNHARASSQHLVCATMTRPAPTVEPTCHIGLFRLRSHQNLGTILCGNSAVGMGIRTTGASPTLRQVNSTTGLDCKAAPTNTWVRIEALFTGTTADYLLVQATKVTGVNVGATHTATGQRIGAFSTHLDFDWAEVITLKTNPSNDSLKALQRYYFGAGT